MLPLFLIVLSSLVVVRGYAAPIDDNLKNAIVGKWKQEMVGARTGGAIIEIASVDQATGRLTGTYAPPSGPAVGQRFELAGWISSAPPQEKADNVNTIAFTVSLAAYDWAHIATGEDIWTKMP